jgi:hypothetical protein
MLIKLGKYTRLLINRTGRPDLRFWNASNHWYQTHYTPIFGFHFFLYEWDHNSGN